MVVSAEGGPMMALKWVALTSALVAGVAMAIQGAFNSALGKVIGLLEATLVVHATGTVLVLGLWLAGLGRGQFNRWQQADWFTFFGGILGVLIVYGVAYSIPKTGAATATTAIIVGQVTMALLIDQFGLFGLKPVPFIWQKAAGLAFLAIGARLMLD
jgi:transporter family-2 protein